MDINYSFNLKNFKTIDAQKGLDFPFKYFICFVATIEKVLLVIICISYLLYKIMSPSSTFDRFRGDNWQLGKGKKRNGQQFARLGIERMPNDAQFCPLDYCPTKYYIYSEQS